MAIRIREIDGVTIAICAARSVEMPGDIYLDDNLHHALANKFARDFHEMWGYEFPYQEESLELVQREENNNPTSLWWECTYGKGKNDADFVYQAISGDDLEWQWAGGVNRASCWLYTWHPDGTVTRARIQDDLTSRHILYECSVEGITWDRNKFAAYKKVARADYEAQHASKPQ